MGKTVRFKVEIPEVRPRNPHALDAMMRRSEKFKDRRKERGGAKNWKHYSEEE
jgi:FKBP-type peptidyl-prolyl cis-trans isomerase 2